MENRFDNIKTANSNVLEKILNEPIDTKRAIGIYTEQHQSMAQNYVNSMVLLFEDLCRERGITTSPDPSITFYE